MPLLEIAGLSVDFDSTRHPEKRRAALVEVSLGIEAGETVALVGESGSGKTTLARSIVRLIEPDRGTVRFDGLDLAQLGGRDLAKVRSRIGLVMQDSASALNPRRRVAASVSSPLDAQPKLDRGARARRVEEALENVGLPPMLGSRRPDELSGGQRQRACVARALVTGPELLICDEPLAGLDLVTELAMLEILREATREAACLFITHDLFLAAAIGDRIAVMEKGRIVEEGPAGDLLSRPAHPHTKALIKAIPPADPDPAWRDRHEISSPAQPPFDAGT